jgi:hypothetical protein
LKAAKALFERQLKDSEILSLLSPFTCLQAVNVAVAVASFQALLKQGGLDEYYYERCSTIVRHCFILATVHTLIHAVLLLRIRTFLSMRQLKAVCLYKLLVNLFLPFLWSPEISPHVRFDRRVALALRGAVTAVYVFGYLWAGKAEGVSRILTSE